MQLVYQRCAAAGVAKKQIAVCVRTPGDGPGERRSQVRKYKTFYGVLMEMCAWLRECGVTHVAMESTGIYSNPVFHALTEFGGLWLTFRDDVSGRAGRVCAGGLGLPVRTSVS